MISVERSAVIERSVQDVWAFVADPRNEPKWHTDILELKAAEDPASGPVTRWVLGDTLLVSVQFMGRMKYEVEITRLETDRCLQFTTRTGPIKPVSTYVFEPENGSTRFTRHVNIPLRGPWRLMKPLMRREVQRRNSRFVQNLKTLLEQESQ